jgi:peroxiredoxin
MSKEAKRSGKDRPSNGSSKKQSSQSQDFYVQQTRNRRRRNERNIKIIFSAICLITLLLTSYGIWQYYDTQKPPIIGGAVASGGTQNVLAPDFSLQDINGTQVSLSQYRGKVIGIHFMAVGCHGDIYPINEYQLTQISNAFNDLTGENATFLTVAVATCESSELDKIRSNYGVSWILGNDYSDQALEIVNSYVPFEIGDGAVVLVDKDFKIAEVYNGGVSASILVSKINQLFGV